MSRYAYPLLHLAAVLLFAALLLPLGQRAHASASGEPLLGAAGRLAPGQHSQRLPVYIEGSAEQVNLRLALVGQGQDAPLTLLLLNSAGATLRSWAVRADEIVWGSAELPAGAAFRLENGTGAAIEYRLDVYALDAAPAFAGGRQTWSGVGHTGGTPSTITLGVPSGGLYRVLPSAATGAFELVVDAGGMPAGRALLRTAVRAGDAAAGGVYYLPAGEHSFSVAPAFATTSWSVALEALTGDTNLPFGTQSAPPAAGSFARESWMPLYTSVAQSVDLRLAASGAGRVEVELYHGDQKLFGASVRGGEVVWGSATLPAGTSALRLVVPESTGTTGYEVQVELPHPLPLAWRGTSLRDASGAAPQPSAIRLHVPTSGFYSFDFGADAGRFQLVLGDNLLRKTAGVIGTSISAYIDAGSYALTVQPDPAQSLLNWRVAVQPGDTAGASLPYSAAGALDAVGPDLFGEEWLPLHALQGAPVNLKLMPGGTASEALLVELYNGDQLTYRAPQVYGGELLWLPAALTSGANRLHIAATSAALNYQLEVAGVGATPATWSGIAYAASQPSVVQVDVPVDGIYDLALRVSEGAARPLVGVQATETGIGTRNASVSLRVPLRAGINLITIEHDSTLPRTLWELDVQLRRASVPLAIEALTPGRLPAGSAANITLTGTGFDTGTLIELLPATGAPITLQRVVVSDTQIAAQLPAGLAVGSYSLRVANPDGRAATRNDALTLDPPTLAPDEQWSIFLPLVQR